MSKKRITLPIDDSLWEHFFLPFPLVLIGSKEGDHYDMAPKHKAMPMSWKEHFGFICTPNHNTYQNIKEHKVFTVSYPKPDQVILASLTATPRCDEDKDKSVLNFLPTIKAEKIDGVFLKDSFLMFECELHKIYDDFGVNSLITGKIINAQVNKKYMREWGRDEQKQLFKNPLLAYIYPGRFAKIKKTMAFPFPKDFKR